MVEVLLSVALLATVVSIFQLHKHSLSQRLSALQSTYKLESREHFQRQVSTLFEIDLPMEGEPGEKPYCSVCRDAVLKQLLQYELYQ